MTSRTYKAPSLFFSPHLETIFPSLMRRVSLQAYTRERISTPDDDFLDLDWLTQNSKKLVIISHGLEGSSQRPYIKGMAKVFFENGYDVAAWNYRGCGEEMNKQLRFYHSGATDDLNVVIDHAIDKKGYNEIYLVGFSLGGNITLKFMGEKESRKEIKKAVGISVPLDLKTSCEKISEPGNWIYSRRFLKSLKLKVSNKSKLMREIDVKGIDKIKTLKDFDDRYTAPLHGFKDAYDYYSKCSSINFLKTIRKPVLILNAANDPFLSKECFPDEAALSNPMITFEILSRGGHVGFAQFGKNGVYWSEQRAFDFINQP